MAVADKRAAAALIQLLQPGMSVYVPGSSGEPTAALRLLGQAPERCEGVHFITSFVPGINDFDLSSLGPGARFTAFFMHPSLQLPNAEGRVTILELPYSGIARWLAEHPVDLAITQVAAETHSARFNLGPAVEFTPIVLKHAAVRVAVQNHQTPWLGASFEWPIAGFHLVMESDTPLPIYPNPETSPIYERIGAHVAALIPDGATLQTGLGQAPAATMAALAGHHGLGLHTGVFSDSLLRLIDRGVMAPGKNLVTGVAVGTRAFYQQLPNYPDIRYAAVTETHSLDVLLAIPSLFTINSAIEVDLQGNLNAEFLAGQRISGRGGLPDFAAAGHCSAQGDSLIVLPSTDGSGTHSRIVTRLETTATVPGELIDCVITEQGCARLKGNSPAQRAKAMRAIAAPRMRKSLTA